MTRDDGFGRLLVGVRPISDCLVIVGYVVDGVVHEEYQLGVTYCSNKGIMGERTRVTGL